MNNPKEVDRIIERAAKSYKLSDDGRWAAAYYAAQIVGKHELGATLALANRMGVSSDTVENLAHAYQMYREFFCDPRYKLMVRAVRRLPYIYYSTFRALHKAKNDYNLPLEKVWSILVDMVQAEGTLHQRDLEQHIRNKFGDTRNWQYYGAKTMKQISILLQQPDLPKEVRDALIPAHEVLGDKA